LRAYGIPVRRVAEAVRGGNNETSGGLLEFGGTEYMVRGRGYAHSLDDFGNISLGVTESGSQIRIKDVGQVVMAPADFRRGVSDLDGAGEVVSGIVIRRSGENALDVIDAKANQGSRTRASDGVKLFLSTLAVDHNTVDQSMETILRSALRSFLSS
jgi:Cu/Ag efflux pump CusA